MGYYSGTDRFITWKEKSDVIYEDEKGKYVYYWLCYKDFLGYTRKSERRKEYINK
jgi:hypothetical protein